MKKNLSNRAKTSAIIVLLLVAFFSVFFVVPTVKADTVLFGNTNVGSGWAGYAAGVYTTNFTSPADAGTISELVMYLQASAGSVKAVIYADTGLAIGSLLATGSSTPKPGTDSWVTCPIDFDYSPNTSYFLGIVSSTDTYIYRQFSIDRYMCAEGGSGFFDSPPNPPSSPNYYVNYQLSIYAAYDTTPPTFGSITGNTTAAGAAVQYSCTVSDNVAVSGFIPSWNNSGQWVNGSWTAGGAGILTGNHNSTIGNHISVQFYANDSSNNWAASSTSTFTLTDGNAPTFGAIFDVGSNIAHGAAHYTCTVSDNVAVSGYIASWNNSGSWTNKTWTSGSAGSLTGTLNNTVGVVVSVKFYANDSSNNWGTSSQYDVTLLGYYLNMTTVDVASQPLQNTAIIVNGTAHALVGGWYNITGIPYGDRYLVSASWRNISGVTITYNFQMTSNAIAPLSCNVYPFTFNGATRYIGINRTVLTNSWSSNQYTFTLDSSLTANSFLVDAGQRPTYILGDIYDLATDWNSTTSLFQSQIENTTFTLTVGFDAWGSFYVQKTTAALTSFGWSGYTLNGLADSSGTLQIYANGRGAPEHTAGLTTVTFNSTSTMLSGNFNATVPFSIDWAVSHEGSGNNNQNPPQSTAADLTVLPVGFGSFKQNQSATVTLPVSFSGSTCTITAVSFQGIGSELLGIKTALPAGFTQGSGILELQLTTAADTAPGNYTVVVQVTGVDPFGVPRTATASLTFMVEDQTATGDNFIPPGTMPYFIVGAVIAIIVLVAVALLTRRRR